MNPVCPQACSRTWRLNLLSVSADLPLDLLARIFSRILVLPAVWGTVTPGGQDDIQRLRPAVILASVSRHWREAAIQALQSRADKPLNVDANLWSGYLLSPLLISLVRGRRAIMMSCTLLATLEALHFLHQTQPDALRAHGSYEESGSVGSRLADCHHLSSLECVGGFIPDAWPPSLRSLDVNPRSSLTSFADQHVADLLLSALALPTLQELKLSLSTARVLLPSKLRCLDSLRRLSIAFTCTSGAQLQNFAALRTAAAGGVCVSLEVDLETGEASVRHKLWRALAQASPFDQLHLELGSAQPLASAAELQLLASVECKQLVLVNALDAAFAQQVLGSLRHSQLYCAIWWADSNSLSWTHLSGHAGIYMLETGHGQTLTIEHFARTVPAFAEPWALVIKQPQEGVLRGLPTHAFRAGPQGHLVWSNSAVTDSSLVAAYAALPVRLRVYFDDS